VEDQQTLGSCTAQALVGAMEFNIIRDKEGFRDLSRLFVYYNERVIAGTVASDSGAYIRDGIKTLARSGVCDESLWPYDIAKFARLPPARAYAQAARRKITQYARAKDLGGVLDALADGHPVAFGFDVFPTFMSGETARTGLAQMPKPGAKCEGGHAVLAVGYDDAREVLIVRNSWGEAWGDKGYFYLPYGYVRQDLAADFWAVEAQENPTSASNLGDGFWNWITSLYKGRKS
jgi:C1A family cysteine protease